MNVWTYGTSTGFDQADLHHVQRGFQMNCISCLTGSNDHIHYEKCKVLWYSLNWDIFRQLYMLLQFLNLETASTIAHKFLYSKKQTNQDHFKLFISLQQIWFKGLWICC